jgi:hypothetical protein
MTSAPYQFFAGAWSPLDKAQSLLSAGSAFVRNAGFIVLLSVIAAKHCALNAMPLTALNGGDAVSAIARHIGLTRWWPKRATMPLFFCLFGAFISWALAIVVYVLST